MKPILAAAAVALAFAALGIALPATAAPISIVAAENVYGEAVTAIGGDRVAVDSVIVAPGVDPHAFEPPPSVAAALAEARIVIVNGAGYDHWVERLLGASDVPGRRVIDVAGLIGVADGGNPHVWYHPDAMPALARALTAALVAIDPDGEDGYAARRDDFLDALAPLGEAIAAVRARHAGTAVAATEPVFGHMAAALGLDMRNRAFQTAIMNETEPAAGDIAAMEDDIRAGRVKVLFYNSQVEDAFTRGLAALAEAAGVPLVGVTETQPAGTTFVEWMLGTVEATGRALGDPSS